MLISSKSDVQISNLKAIFFRHIKLFAVCFYDTAEFINKLYVCCTSVDTQCNAFFGINSTGLTSQD